MAWCVGERTGVLQRAIDGLKFERQVDAAEVLAELLDAHLPVIPTNTVIVPIPTIAPHIRQRGYDQTRLIAKRLARRRGLKVVPVLERRHSHTQRGHTKKQRYDHAKSAFACRRTLDADTPYLLLDDVVTTGATLQYAAQTLLEAGARSVWVAAIARQPLEK